VISNHAFIEGFMIHLSFLFFSFYFYFLFLFFILRLVQVKLFKVLPNLPIVINHRNKLGRGNLVIE
jgi:hypothetical protein